MSRYVLAKDLPFAKAGTAVYLQDKINDDPYIWIINPYEGGIGNKLGLASVLLKQGWIKEVLPRMWYVPESILKEYGSPNKDKFFNGRVRHDLVKVIEVLE